QPAGAGSRRAADDVLHPPGEDDQSRRRDHHVSLHAGAAGGRPLRRGPGQRLCLPRDAGRMDQPRLAGLFAAAQRDDTLDQTDAARADPRLRARAQRLLPHLDQPPAERRAPAPAARRQRLALPQRLLPLPAGAAGPAPPSRLPAPGDLGLLMIPTFARLNSRIGRNAAVKLGSEVAGRAASLALLLLAARRLGASAFGLYNYGIALGFVVTQLADLGLQMLVAREVARQGKAAQPLVRAALQLKMLLSLGVVLLLGWLAAGYESSVRLALFGLGLMMLAQTYLEFAAYVFRGQQRLAVEARLLAAARLATAVIGGLVLLFGGGLLALTLSSLLAVGVTVAWAFVRLYRAGWLAPGRA